ncbi:hypothetical protein GCM10011613_28990 [Cellvibrio zantedeschiae]|uniref:Glycosyltransferase 2-like domain-containing protein n=1 Tax=Cellvibrio zantedeschiae TaxID=1237077 RepID=A0ABQ3B9W0_9GAMM|nr:glycosyltransferase [Cellvibrio zantedeschiae]GGY82411.1 hypothetical protein GCM10011613_28990 [Cellvibrio zantedeschiae]
MVTETKKLIVVIGMHRTGTSLITRGLQVMGVNLGDNLLPAMADVNAKGFWEDADINAFNIEMLHAINSEWDYLTPITEANIQQLQQQGFFLRAVEILRDKTAQARIFGLKDPRIAKLLPFWDQVFTHCQFDVSYLLTIRHPLSVVKSLQKRDGFVAEKAYLLWFTHVITALTFSNKENLSLVDYDFFMQNSASELARLAKEIDLPINPQELDLFLNEFVDNSLRHTHYELSDLDLDEACPNLVREIYTELLQVARNQLSLSDSAFNSRLKFWYESLVFAKIPFTVIDDLYVAKADADAKVLQAEQSIEQKNQYIENLERFTRERAEQVKILYRDLEVLNQERFIQVKKLNADIVERDTHIKALDENISILSRDLQLSYEHSYRLNAHIQLMTNSHSWKITKPLRFLMRFLKHGLSVEDKSKILLGLRAINQRLPGFVQRFNRTLFGGVIRSMMKPSVPLITSDSQALSPHLVQVGKTPVMPVDSSGKDFIVWGVIDWHFRHQRPQQIAQALAEEGDRVFYVSSNLIEAKVPGFSIEPLDKQGRLFQINLCVKSLTVIYHHAPSADVTQQLLASIGELLLWAKTQKIINLVQHPFWYPIAQQLPNSQLVYDCMDHHEGFENTGKEVIALEHELFRAADLTVTTSGFLDDIVAKHTSRREVIRNAGEYEYFSQVPADIYRDAKGRKIIGYYGAIAEWFDIELIRLLSQRFNDCLIVLVGADTVNAKAQLKSQHNIVFIGEVPYPKLTHYLYAFDVCLLPFKVIPLILATNPVKVYEYLGAGKPVVAVDVPEIKQFGDLVRVGTSHDNFAEQVAAVLAEPVTDTAIAARKAFAEQQTWHHRARDLSRALNNLQIQPKVSVIVVTYNNLDLTKQCLMSLDKFTDYSNLEIIVVDNASSDDSPAYLSEWSKQGDNRILILNPDNKGFAAGNNQGLVVATGDYLVLLNNDTHVTPGWVTSLVKHMQRDQSIGLLGPVTGNIGNEAKIAIQYSTMEEMLIESSKFTLRHIGQLTPLRTAAFFCVMISRAAYEKVGLLDEAFGIGFFEDDDYCRRVEQAGFTIYCADDVFIHHHLSASFNKLKMEARQKLFEQNKVTYEKKWGPWVPHSYRPGVN